MALRMALLIKGRAKWQSYGFGFIAAGLSFNILRCAFFVKISCDPPDPDANMISFRSAFYFLWLPLSLEYSAFSLLAHFFFAVLLQKHWRERWRRVLNYVWGITNGFIALSLVVWTVATDLELQKSGPAAESSSASLEAGATLFMGVVFLLLSAVFTAQGFLFLSARCVPLIAVRRMTASSPRGLAALCMMFGLLFLTRSAYDLLSAFGVLSVSVRLTSADDIPPAAFAMYLVWELLPTFLLLLFAHQRRVGRRAGRTRNTYLRAAGDGFSPDFSSSGSAFVTPQFSPAAALTASPLALSPTALPGDASLQFKLPAASGLFAAAAAAEAEAQRAGGGGDGGGGGGGGWGTAGMGFWRGAAPQPHAAPAVFANAARYGDSGSEDEEEEEDDHPVRVGHAVNRPAHLLAPLEGEQPYPPSSREQPLLTPRTG